MAELVYSADTRDDEDTRYMEAHYILIADIDLGVSKEWMPIGSSTVGHYSWFRGVFDGDGHTVSGIKIDYKDPLIGDKYGEFGLLADMLGTIKNLTISDSSVVVDSKNAPKVGAVAGKVSGNGIVENCHTTDTVTVLSTYDVGGICGWVSSDVPLRGCTNGAAVTATSNSGSISSEGYAAGICGNANGGISDCSNSGSVEADRDAAGIILSFDDGALNDSMSDSSIVLARCTNTGDVTSIGTGNDIGRMAGGIAVSCRGGSVVDCKNEGKVTAGGMAGGIFAYFQPSAFGTPAEQFTVSGCINSGDVLSTDAAGGGICSTVYGSKTRIVFDNCHNSGSIYANYFEGTMLKMVFVGGMIGSCTTEGNEVNTGALTLEMVSCENTGTLGGQSELAVIATSDLCASEDNKLEE